MQKLFSYILSFINDLPTITSARLVNKTWYETLSEIKSPALLEKAIDVIASIKINALRIDSNYRKEQRALIKNQLDEQAPDAIVKAAHQVYQLNKINDLQTPLRKAAIENNNALNVLYKNYYQDYIDKYNNNQSKYSCPVPDNFYEIYFGWLAVITSLLIFSEDCNQATQKLLDKVGPLAFTFLPPLFNLMLTGGTKAVTDYYLTKVTREEFMKYLSTRDTLRQAIIETLEFKKPFNEFIPVKNTMSFFATKPQEPSTFAELPDVRLKR